jgi:acyl carrier protein
MTNNEKYVNAFIEAFKIDEFDESKLPGLKYREIEEWDSVGHMVLMALIEDGFDIMLETDDIIDFSSFEAGKTILATYDVIVE